MAKNNPKIEVGQIWEWRPSTLDKWQQDYEVVSVSEEDGTIMFKFVGGIHAHINPFEWSEKEIYETQAHCWRLKNHGKPVEAPPVEETRETIEI